MHCQVWTAPLVKGVLRLRERLGCGHVFGLFALGRDPLALMIRPLGSLPQSPYRTRLGADKCIWLPSLIRWFTSPLGHPRSAAKSAQIGHLNTPV